MAVLQDQYRLPVTRRRDFARHEGGHHPRWLASSGRQSLAFGRVYGVVAAAYFGLSVAKLTVPHAALLAGMVNSPPLAREAEASTLGVLQP
jgi:hypothetical protein